MVMYLLQEMLAEVDDIKSKNGQDKKFKVCIDSQMMSEAVSCGDECVLSKRVASAAKTNVVGPFIKYYDAVYNMLLEYLGHIISFLISSTHIFCVS